LSTVQIIGIVFVSLLCLSTLIYCIINSKKILEQLRVQNISFWNDLDFNQMSEKDKLNFSDI
jgi:hypothetical protein